MHVLAIPQKQLHLARTCFEKYVRYMEENHEQAMDLVVHQILHLCDDAESFQTFLGAISAYPFENFLREVADVSFAFKMPARRKISFINI